MSQASASIEIMFAAEHRQCDTLWSAVEQAADSSADALKQAYETFSAAMLRHLAMEEEVLFPAVEQAVGLPPGVGPTAVMRHEHEQMRGLLTQMRAELDRGNTEGLLDHGDTLLMLIQQHNLKEEGVLYPMADERLSRAELTQVMTRLKAY